MSEYGGDPGRPDVRMNADFDLPAAQEATPEMEATSRQFEQNMQDIFATRGKAVAQMSHHEALDELEMEKIFKRCRELEREAIRQEIYHSTKIAEPSVDMSYLGWDLDNENATTFFHFHPDMLVRQERFLTGTTPVTHNTTYSVQNGQIYQDISVREDLAKDGVNLSGGNDAAELDGEGILNEQEAALTDPKGDLEKSLAAQLMALSDARNLMYLTARLRDAIIQNYQSHGLLESSKS